MDRVAQTPPPPTPLAYAEAHGEAILQELGAFASPQLSTDPAYKALIGAASEWVAERMRAGGLRRM
jgi:hypothetical protein